MEPEALTGELSQLQLGGAVFVDTVEGVQSMLRRLRDGGAAEVAIDLEGVDLCRSGELCILQLSDGETTWVVDIFALEEAAFAEGGLRAFMHDPAVLFVGFDGRADADALAYLYSTRVASFYDVQIASCIRQDREQGRRDRFVHGLGRATERFLRNDRDRALALERTKRAGLALFAPERGGSYAVWKQRPLPKALLDYAAADVALLLDMKREWEVFSPVEENKQKALVRIDRAVHSRLPAKGKQMAMKDF